MEAAPQTGEEFKYESYVFWNSGPILLMSSILTQQELVPSLTDGWRKPWEFLARIEYRTHQKVCNALDQLAIEAAPQPIEEYKYVICILEQWSSSADEQYSLTAGIGTFIDRWWE